MFDSILVICTGNICRSPIAERMLRKCLPHKRIDSAGVGAMVDNPADDMAIYISSKHGLGLTGHKGRQFSSSMAREYELILVMENKHIEEISKIAPQARGKVMLLGYWMNSKQIPDPYRKSEEAFESVYQLMEKSCELWAAKLAK
ncbi:protein tyrosine phosphatase [Klebsiella pneumoniae]|uniref:arsenate reductase/protein-tyrosine-phosphatase family protein n=1 Tax=Klebsiella pneumoniae TaxID=573 RepID=UPI002FF40559